ncbi:MAG: ACP S-malonyltransferase [Pseudomonadota bacterium]
MTIALVFPGQGSQAVGMLSALAAQESIVTETFAEASEALGYDLWAVVSEDPEGRLSSTEVTQPALLTASTAIYRVWRQREMPAPSVMAGHSLGEYSALVAAEALNFSSAVKLVESRGRFMQEAVPQGQGAMAAILGLDDDVVLAACADVSAGVVAAVNFNAPGQVVIAGDKVSVDAAIERCKEAGARRALPLPVSVPSHCALMLPAAERLQALLGEIEIQSPTIPVINNVDVKVESEPNDIRDALVRQLHSPVRWVESMRSLGKHGVTRLVECGPGKVLAGLQKRIDRKMAAFATETPDDLEKFVASDGS